MYKLLALISIIWLGGCGGDQTMSEPTQPASYIVIATHAEALAEVGSVVRVTGVVQREKPGDVVLTGDLDVLCPDYRFAEELVGTEVTVEGTLRQMNMPEATVDDTGAISQGVMPGSPPRFVIDGCAPL